MGSWKCDLIKWLQQAAFTVLGLCHLEPQWQLIISSGQEEKIRFFEVW